MQLENKQSVSLPYLTDEKCDSDGVVLTNEVVCGGVHSLDEFHSPASCEPQTSENNSASMYEAQDLFLKDILSSAFLDDTLVSLSVIDFRLIRSVHISSALTI